MATDNVNLNFDAKGAFGEYLPTVYIDFVDVSYGATPILSDDGTETGLTLLGTDPEKGTFINGSFSIYFTKEDSQSDDEVEEWIQNNLDDLYVYSWLSAYSQLNAKVASSALDLRELFFAFSSAHRDNFTSASPAFPYVIEVMKDAFFNDTFRDATDWRTDDGTTIATETLLRDIDTPGTWTYGRFWGTDERISEGTAATGPWNAPPEGFDILNERSAEAGMGHNEMYISEGVSFMQTYIHRALYALIGTTSTNDYNVEGSGGAHFTMQKISDFANPDHYRKEGIYDENGDEIAVLINIPINFRVDNASVSNRLDALGDIFIIAAVGRNILDTDGDSFTGASHPGEMLPEFAAMNSALFNANFGDITYEHILTGTGRGTNTLDIANPTREIFVSKSTNAPYNGQPIMSIDGEYHAAQPMSQRRVLTVMQQLLDKYAKTAKTNKKLKKNLNNLANILQKNKKIDLLPQLQLFRKTYPQKSTATPSGKLYEAFKKLLYSVNKNVKLQQILKKVKITNNKVIDSRFNQSRVSYIIPSPNGLATAPMAKGTYLSVGNDYVPIKWSNLARSSMKTYPVPGLLTEGAQFILEEGLPTTTGFGADALTLDAPAISDESPAWEEYMDQFYALRGEGTGRFEGETFAGEISDDTAIPGSEHPMVRPYDDSDAFTTDTVVQNYGYFHFDYEKAVHTQSKLAHVIPVWKIERYLGLHVPWDYYRVTAVSLTRIEAKFQTTMGRDWLGEVGATMGEWNEAAASFGTWTLAQQGTSFAQDPENYATIKLTAIFDGDKDYPLQARSIYEYDVENLRYGQPMVYLASTHEGEQTMSSMSTDIDAYSADGAIETSTEAYGASGTITDATTVMQTLFAAGAQQYEADITHTTDAYSYLAMVNFDAPLGAIAGSVADPTSGAPTGRLWDYHSWKVRGGYRLMTFEFKDFMDDDVAYYNTVGIGDFNTGITGWDRSSLATQYEILIKVEDRSLKMVNDVYEIFKSNYDKFITDYYNLAIATCSFNNINDQFNDFFVNGITEEFPSAKDQQWLRAPYMLNLAKNIFFRAFEDDDTTETTHDALVKNAAQIAQQIGPHDGRLMHLNNFKISYEKMLNLIKPQVDSTVTTPAEGRRLFGAKAHGDPRDYAPEYNYHPIYDQILLQGGSSLPTSENWGSETVVNTEWDNAIASMDEYTFQNTIPITEPIYGDMFLSALYAWDYQPPHTTRTFVLGEAVRFIRDLQYICDPDTTPSTFPGLYSPEEGHQRTINVYGASLGSSHMSTSVTSDGYKNAIDQMLALCFVYRYGPALADLLGIDLSDEDGDDLRSLSDASFQTALINMIDAHTGTPGSYLEYHPGILILLNGWRHMHKTVSITEIMPFIIDFSVSTYWDAIWSEIMPVCIMRVNDEYDPWPSDPVAAASSDFANNYYKTPIIIYNQGSGPEADFGWHELSGYFDSTHMAHLYSDVLDSMGGTIGGTQWLCKMSRFGWGLYNAVGSPAKVETLTNRAFKPRIYTSADVVGGWTPLSITGASTGATQAYYGDEGNRQYGPVYWSGDFHAGFDTVNQWYIYPGGQHDQDPDGFGTIPEFSPPAHALYTGGSYDFTDTS